ncbi:MAG TPA: response regulator, partial [Chitinophagales bacterium]|nr:response regulator [Chitinophagales bacterium]
MSNRILLVDDEEKLLNHLFEALSAKGYEVVTAKNGLAALKLYEEQRFDLVILDIMMPEIDGHQV